MKHIVSDHALAIGAPFLAETATGKTEMQLYECGNTGILFALDCAWLDDACDHADTMEIPLVIPSFVDEGTAIILVDKEEEINLTIKAVGEEHPEKLIDDVITTKHITRPLGNLKALPQLLSLINEVPSSETVPSSFIPLKNIK